MSLAATAAPLSLFNDNPDCADSHEQLYPDATQEEIREHCAV